jgi:hypothetical protein
MTSSGEPPSITATDKLRFDAGTAPEGKASARALHVESNTPVVVAAADGKEVERLRPWSTVHHAHLSKLVEIIEVEADKFWVAVAAPAGELLSERLRSVGKKHPVDSVRTALRVADALATLHEAGGAHGRLHPDTVLLEPEQGVEPQVLYGAPGPREYWPPDCSVTEPPSVLTDTWATGALLFHMLTGKTPPSMGIFAADELAGMGIDDPLLREAVAHALNKDKTARADTLQPLRRELARWFVEHIGEEPGPHSVSSHKPPPLPQSLHPAHKRASSAGAARLSVSSGGSGSIKRYLLPVVVAVVLGLAAAYTTAALRKPKRIVVERPLPTVQKTEAQAASGAIDLAEVPVTGNEAKVGSDSVTTCMAGFLPEGALAKQANLSNFCPASDLRQAMKTLRSAFAPVPGGGAGTPKGWNDLVWFELAALSILRSGCCNNVPKYVWPSSSPDCPPLGEVLDTLGRAVSTTQDVDAAISRFKEAAHCEVTKGRPDLSRPTSEPTAEAERLFRDMFHVGTP